MKSTSFVAILSLAALAEACGEDHSGHAARHAQLQRRQAGNNPPASVSLVGSNPTGVPLQSISANMESLPIAPLPTTAVLGSTPTTFPKVPPLPAAAINPADYPAQEAIPPTDSPQVKRWIAEVAASGIVIPTLSQTNPGGCQNNTALLADPDGKRCWWTCGGCVTADDISECKEKNHWGLTFDDGPGFYTPNLLEYLDEVNVKATFFVIGSRVIQFPETLQSEHVAGHQIAVHTWSHKRLTELSNEEIIAELGWTKKAIRDVIGVTPTHMRPPHGDIDNRVRAISHAMGLTPIMWTRHSDSETGPDGVVFNTQDFDIRTGFTSTQVLGQWQRIMQTVPRLQKGFITLQHDLFQEFVHLATGYILPDALARTPKFTIEPVITCNAMPLSNAYVETNDNSTNPFKAKLANVGDDSSSVTLRSTTTATVVVGLVGLITSLVLTGL